MIFLIAAARRFWSVLDAAPPARRAPFTAAADQPASPTSASWILHAR